MNMTRSEAIEEVCAIVGLAYHSIGNYSYPSDGFCDKCNNKCKDAYQNSGEVIDYVRQAVRHQLINDGFSIAEGFDPKTGKEIKE
jgi:hypothetical protein